jgi:glycosyltransferase involved in cell wall biosynthesis
MWHVLDANSIWIREFAEALGEHADVRAWVAHIRIGGAFEKWERISRPTRSQMWLHEFPLQRGYARFPLARLLDYGGDIAKRLSRQGDARYSPLVCTTPFYAPVAEKWRGPVIYYQTDLTVEYHGVNKRVVREMDRRMCRVAAAVCPNSARIREYLIHEAGCEARKITVVPNATRAENVADRPLLSAGPLPPDVAGLLRPIAGVIGNMGGNVDWELVSGIVTQTPWLSWILVGPVSDQISDARQNRCRLHLLRHGGRVRFIGPRPYASLKQYAQSFDVAILPYLKREPTYSGSSTRFYEHLAACRPMLATRGFEELLHKEPLLRLGDTAAEFVTHLEQLRGNKFQDGEEGVRWAVSRSETWAHRALAVMSALDGRLTAGATA